MFRRRPQESRVLLSVGLGPIVSDRGLTPRADDISIRRIGSSFRRIRRRNGYPLPIPRGSRGQGVVGSRLRGPRRRKDRTCVAMPRLLDRPLARSHAQAGHEANARDRAALRRLPIPRSSGLATWNRPTRSAAVMSRSARGAKLRADMSWWKPTLGAPSPRQARAEAIEPTSGSCEQTSRPGPRRAHAVEQCVE